MRDKYCLYSWLKVGRKAWERRSHARHFCNLAFPGLKEHFFHGNACNRARKIVLSIGTKVLGHNELVNLNLVKITASLEIQGSAAKLKRVYTFL